MKNAYLALGFALLITHADAEPVKWVDGKVTEASAWKLHPSLVELTTEKGTEKVELKKLDPEWIKAKLPEEDVATLQATISDREREINVLRNICCPVPMKEIVKKIEELAARNRTLEEENAKLKAELKKSKRR